MRGHILNVLLTIIRLHVHRMGLHSIVDASTYSWSDGTAVTASDYSPWAAGQPAAGAARCGYGATPGGECVAPVEQSLCHPRASPVHMGIRAWNASCYFRDVDAPSAERPVGPQSPSQHGKTGK